MKAAKICNKCAEPIKDENNMTRIVDKDIYWHNDCYRFTEVEYGINTDDMDFELDDLWN